MFGTRTHWLPKRIVIMLFGLVVLAALGWPQSAFAVVRWSASLQVQSGDYSMLDSYGDWVQVPGFGTVWRPSVVQDWAPFEHGHWTWTNNGWTWVSYEPFGWLVYHYGYWYFDDQVGWFWIPGNDWSPARVQWNTFGDYSAWAPMPPPNHYWRDPWDRSGPRVWLVVNVNHFTDDDIYRQRVSDPPGRETFKRGIVRRAPTVKTIERFTNRQIAPVRIARERVAPPPVTTPPPGELRSPPESPAEQNCPPGTGTDQGPAVRAPGGARGARSEGDRTAAALAGPAAAAATAAAEKEPEENHQGALRARGESHACSRCRGESPLGLLQ